MRVTIPLTIFLTLFFQVANCARILCYYPVPAISHQFVYRALTQELARRGHELVVITPDPYLQKDRPADNITEIDVHDVSYLIWKNRTSNMANRKGRPVEDFHNIILKANTEVIDAQLDVPEVKALIQNKSEHFDLLIVTCVVRPAYFFSHRFKAPVIGFSSMAGVQYNYEAMGVPNHPLLYHDFFQKKVGNLTFWDKVGAIYTAVWQKYAYLSSAAEENRIGRKHFGEDTPDIQQLVYNNDLMFFNVDPVWDGIRPTPPSVIYVGGLHIKPPKALPMDLKNYLDTCKQGVIYMSLGSNIKSAELPAHKVKIFLKVFEKLPFCVLWKWEADQLLDKPDNVRIEKWLPQMDLLGHPHVRAFITQGGLQSTDEAISCEVPLIGIPFIIDQEKTVQKYIHHGVGVALNIGTISPESLNYAIERVTKDIRYIGNLRRLNALRRDQPMAPLQRAAWWTEYVLRHGGARHLRSPAAGVPAHDYFALDVLGALAAGALLALVLLVFVLRVLYKNLQNKVALEKPKVE